MVRFTRHTLVHNLASDTRIFLVEEVPCGYNYITRDTIEIVHGRPRELRYKDYFTRHTNPERVPRLKLCYGFPLIETDITFEAEEIRDSMDIIITVENGVPQIQFCQRSKMDRFWNMLY